MGLKRALEKLGDLVLKNDEFDPWLDEIDPLEALGTVEEEMGELLEDLKAKNREKVKEEMGDLLWTVFITLSVVVREFGLNPEEVVDALAEKMRKRKPYIFEGKKVSLEEAHRIWREAKDEG